MRLFDEIQREPATPAPHAEPYASFLNRAGGDYWDDIRSVLEEWFGRLCVDSRPDVRSRLRSSDDRQFNGAFLELYVHEALIQCGFAVECHPVIDRRARRPDFLALKDDVGFYVEARALSRSDESVVATNRRNVVYDALNQTDSPNFFLWVDVDEAGDSALSTRPLRRSLEVWLADQDPGAVGATLRDRGLRALPHFTWESQGWRIHLRPIPKPPKARGSHTGLRPLGLYGGIEAEWIDDTTPLREALSDKGSAYGDLDHGLVIALASFSISTDDFSVLNALYGSDQVQILGTDPDGELITRNVRAPDGYWYGGTEWRHRNVSGVLLAHNLHPGSIADEVPTFWEHPDPLMPVTSQPCWRRAAAADGQLVYSAPTQPVRDLFRLTPTWPRGDRFPDEA